MSVIFVIRLFMFSNLESILESKPFSSLEIFDINLSNCMKASLTAMVTFIVECNSAVLSIDKPRRFYIA